MTIVTGAPTTAHVPHKQWSLYEEIQNYVVIERWGSLLATKLFPVRDQLLIPAKLWAGPLEHQNYLEIERWAQQIQQGHFKPLHVPHKTWAFGNYSNASMELDNYRYLESWALGFVNYPAAAEPPPVQKPPGGILRHQYLSSDPQIFGGNTAGHDEKVIALEGAGPGPGGQNVVQLSTDHTLNTWTTIFTGTGSTGGGSSLQITSMARDATNGYYLMNDTTALPTVSYRMYQILLSGGSISPTLLFTLTGTNTGVILGPFYDFEFLIHPISGNFITLRSFNNTGISMFTYDLVEITPGGSLTVLHSFGPTHDSFDLNCITTDGAVWGEDIVGSTSKTVWRWSWFTHAVLVSGNVAPHDDQVIPTPGNTVLLVSDTLTWPAPAFERTEMFWGVGTINAQAAVYINFSAPNNLVMYSTDMTVVYYSSTQGRISPALYTIWEMT